MPFAIESKRGKCTNVTLRCLPRRCCYCYTVCAIFEGRRDFYVSRKPSTETQGARPFAGGIGITSPCRPADHFKMGERSFPKLKIPHQSHADFCSTDTAGGLDNKKRRYAPRGGVAYRLFLWGFPKGATPPFGTRLCEAKCSVLYALPALP